DDETRPRAFDRDRLHVHVVLEIARHNVGDGWRSLTVDFHVDHFIAREFGCFGLGKSGENGLDTLWLPLAPAASSPIRAQHQHKSQCQQTQNAPAVFSFDHVDFPLNPNGLDRPSSIPLSLANSAIVCSRVCSSEPEQSITSSAMRRFFSSGICVAMRCRACSSVSPRPASKPASCRVSRASCCSGVHHVTTRQSSLSVYPASISRAA